MTLVSNSIRQNTWNHVMDAVCYNKICKNVWDIVRDEIDREVFRRAFQRTAITIEFGFFESISWMEKGGRIEQNNGN